MSFNRSLGRRTPYSRCVRTGKRGVVGEEEVHVGVEDVRRHEAALLELGHHVRRHLKQVQPRPLSALLHR